MYRRDEAHERLVEHLREREWPHWEAEVFLRNVGHHSLLSEENVLWVLEQQQRIDTQVALNKIDEHQPVLLYPAADLSPIARGLLNLASQPPEAEE